MGKPENWNMSRLVDEFQKVVRRLDQLQKTVDLLYGDREILENIQGRLTALEEQWKLTRQHDVQVKQDIKTAIETKGIPMTNVAFTEYANKILEISGGGGEVDEYFYYAKSYYTITNNSTLFSKTFLS